MKKSSVVLASFVLGGSILLGGCGSAANQASTSQAASVEKPNVALVSLFADDQWSAQFLGGVQDTAKKYGISLTESQAAYNQSEMVTQLDTAIAQHPKVIIVNHAASDAALRPAIAKAVKQGIKVVTVSINSPGQGAIEMHQDNAQLAKLSLEAMGKAINYKGNIAVAWVGGFAPMDKRMEVLKTFLKDHPDIHVVAQYGNASNTTISDTMSRTEAVLRQYGDGQLAAIWASWDQFAIGAIRADEALHRNVPVYSIDLSDQDISTMRQANSPWKASAGTDVYAYGEAVMRYAIQAGYGKQLPSLIQFPGALVTQDNLPSKNTSIHDFISSKNPSENTIGDPDVVAKLTGTK